MTKSAPPHPHPTATFHLGDGATIDLARTALEDLVHGCWTGEPRWMRGMRGVAARRDGDAVELVAMPANFGLSRFELIWWERRRVVGAVVAPCDRGLLPASFDTGVDMLAAVRALAATAIDALRPEALVAPASDDPPPLGPAEAILLSGAAGPHRALLASIDAHVGLCGAAVAACGRHVRIDDRDPALRVQMPSPWRGTTMLDLSDLEVDGIPDDALDLVDDAAADLPAIVEASAETLRGHRRFDLRLRPATFRLDPPGTVEAMRRIARAA